MTTATRLTFDFNAISEPFISKKKDIPITSESSDAYWVPGQKKEKKVTEPKQTEKLASKIGQANSQSHLSENVSSDNPVNDVSQMTESSSHESLKVHMPVIPLSDNVKNVTDIKQHDQGKFPHSTSSPKEIGQKQGNNKNKRKKAKNQKKKHPEEQIRVKPSENETNVEHGEVEKYTMSEQKLKEEMERSSEPKQTTLSYAEVAKKTKEAQLLAKQVEIANVENVKTSNNNSKHPSQRELLFIEQSRQEEKSNDEKLSNRISEHKVQRKIEHSLKVVISPTTLQSNDTLQNSSSTEANSALSLTSPNVFSPNLYNSQDDGLLPTPTQNLALSGSISVLRTTTPSAQIAMVQPVRRTQVNQMTIGSPLLPDSVSSPEPIKLNRTVQTYTRDEMMDFKDKYMNPPDEFEFFLRSLGKLQTYNNPNEKRSIDTEYTKELKVITSLLNKVTSENYQSIAKMLSQIDYKKIYIPENRTILKDYCDCLFHKATTEKEIFIENYAKLHTLIISSVNNKTQVEIEGCILQIIKTNIISLYKHFENNQSKPEKTDKQANLSTTMHDSSSPFYEYDEDVKYQKLKAEEDKKVQFKGSFMLLGYLFVNGRINFEFIEDCFEIIFPKNSTKVPVSSTLLAFNSLMKIITPFSVKNKRNISVLDNIHDRMKSLLPLIGFRVKFLFEEQISSYEKIKKSKDSNSPSTSHTPSESNDHLRNTNPARAFTPLLIPLDIDYEDIISRVQTVFKEKNSADNLIALLEENGSSAQGFILSFAMQTCVCSETNYKDISQAIIDSLKKSIKSDLIEASQIGESLLSVCMVLPYFDKPMKKTLNAIGFLIAKFVFSKIISYSEIFESVFVRLCDFVLEDDRLPAGFNRKSIYKGGLSCTVFGFFLQSLITIESKPPHSSEANKSNRGIAVVSEYIQTCEKDFFSICNDSVKCSFEGKAKYLKEFKIDRLFPTNNKRNQFYILLQNKQNSLTKIEDESKKIKGLPLDIIWSIDCVKQIIGRIDPMKDVFQQTFQYKNVLMLLIPPNATVEIAFVCLDHVLEHFSSIDGSEFTEKSATVCMIRAILTAEIVILPGLRQWCDQFSKLLHKKEMVLKLVEDEFQNQDIRTSALNIEGKK